MLTGPCPICNANDLMEIKEMNHDISMDTLKIDFSCDRCSSFFQYHIENQDQIVKYLQKVENHPERMARDVLIIKNGN